MQWTRTASLCSPLTPTVRLAHAPAPSNGHIPRACSASASRQHLGSTISVRQRPSLRRVGRVVLQVPAPRPRGRSWFLRPRRSPARLIPSVVLTLSDRAYSSTLRPPERPRCRSRSRTPKSALFPGSTPRGSGTHLGRSKLLRITPAPAVRAVVVLRAHTHTRPKGNGQPNPGVQWTRCARH